LNKLVVGVSILIAAAAIALVLSQFINFPTMGLQSTPNKENIASTNSAVVDRSGLSETAFQIGDINLTSGTGPELSLPDLFDKTQRSVVEITDNSASDQSKSRLGSGFVYDNNGHIITNNHVVSVAGTLDVTFLDGTIYRAKVIGSDPYTDLSVLYVPDVPSEKLAPLPLADSSKLRVGQQVAAIGNPFGFSGSMTEGIISGLGRLLSNDQAGQYSIPDVIQTDAPVNPGNSGGPLLNLHGQAVGITTAIYSSTGQFSGIGFAVPANTISKVIPSLITTGSFKHPWLGVSGRDMTPGLAQAIGLKEPRGFLVIDTVAGSPADKAGLKGGTKESKVDGASVKLGGDVIVNIDGKPVRKIDDILVYLEGQKSVGDPIKLTVLREGKALDITAELGARPSQLESP
jgi:S1-C subfamily serine protease